MVHACPLGLDEILRAQASSRRIKEQFTGEVGARSKALDLSGGGSPTATWLTVSKSDIFQALDAQNQVLRKQVLGQAEESAPNSDVVQLSARSFASDQQQKQPGPAEQQPVMHSPPPQSCMQQDSGDSTRTLQTGSPLSLSQRHLVPPLPITTLAQCEAVSGKSLARHGLARDIVDSSLEKTHEPPYSIQPVWNPLTNKIQTTAKPKDYALGPKETHRRELESLHSSQHHVAYAKQMLQEEAANVAAHLARTRRTHTNPYFNTPYHTHPRNLHQQRPTPCEPYQPKWGAEDGSDPMHLTATMASTRGFSTGTSVASRRFLHNHSGGLSQTASARSARSRAALCTHRPFSAPPAQLTRTQRHQQGGMITHGVPSPRYGSLPSHQSHTQPLPTSASQLTSQLTDARTSPPPPPPAPHSPPLPQNAPPSSLPARPSWASSNSSSAPSSAPLAPPTHTQHALRPPSPHTLSLTTTPSAFATPLEAHAIRPSSARRPSSPHSASSNHSALPHSPSAPARYATLSPPRLQVGEEEPAEAAQPPSSLVYGSISPIQEEGQEEELQVQDAEACDDDPILDQESSEITLAPPRQRSRHVSPHPNAPGSPQSPSRSPTSPTATSPKSAPLAARTPAPTPTALGLKGHIFHGGEVDVPCSTNIGHVHACGSAGAGAGHSWSETTTAGPGVSAAATQRGLPPALQALPMPAGSTGSQATLHAHSPSIGRYGSSEMSSGGCEERSGAGVGIDKHSGRTVLSAHALPLPPHIARPLSTRHSMHSTQPQQQVPVSPVLQQGTDCVAVRSPSSSRPGSAQPPRFSPTPTGAAPFQPRLHSVLHRSSTSGRSARPSSAGSTSLNARRTSHTPSHAPPTAAAAAAQQRGGTHWGTCTLWQDAYTVGGTQHTQEQACSWGEVGGVLEPSQGGGAAHTQSMALRTRPASASAAVDADAHGVSQAGVQEKQVSWRPEQATLLSTPRERVRAHADGTRTGTPCVGAAFQSGGVQSMGVRAQKGHVSGGRPTSSKGVSGVSSKASSWMSGRRRAESARAGAWARKQQEAVDPLSVVRVELPGSRGSGSLEAHGKGEHEGPDSAICMRPMSYTNMVEGVARI